MRLPPPPGVLVTVDGHRLHLQRHGHGGPAIVFESALGASSLSWTYVVPEVAVFARACAYDRAGFGWSDPGPLPRTADRIVAELRVMLQRAGISPPFVLVGHSFGGLTARLFAARFGNEVGGLVLLDPAAPEEWGTPSPANEARRRRGTILCRYGRQAARLGIADAVAVLVRLRALRAARATATVAGRGALHRMDEEVLAPAGKLPPELRAIAQRFWTQPRFFEALGSQIESVCASARSVPPDQDFGDTPVVVVSSQTSADATLARHAALASRSRRGRHVVAERSGHWIPLDRPDVVVAAIREVVDAGH